MINSTIIKAADCSTTTLANLYPDPREMLSAMGVGYLAFGAWLERAVKEFGDEPETLAAQAWLAGLLAERFMHRLDGHPEEAENIVTLSRLFPQEKDDASADILDDLVDALWGIYQIDVPEGTPGVEIAQRLLTKLREDPDADQRTISQLERLIGGTE